MWESSSVSPSVSSDSRDFLRLLYLEVVLVRTFEKKEVMVGGSLAFVRDRRSGMRAGGGGCWSWSEPRLVGTLGKVWRWLRYLLRIGC